MGNSMSNQPVLYTTPSQIPLAFFLSVRCLLAWSLLSKDVCPAACHMLVLCLNGKTYLKTFLPSDSPIILVSYNSTKAYGLEYICGTIFLSISRCGGIQIFGGAASEPQLLILANKYWCRYFCLPLYDKNASSVIIFKFYQKTCIIIAVVNILMNYRQ